MSDRYAVMGNPIAHSKSPRIHALFAAQTGQDLIYEAIRVEPGDFAAAVDRFRAAGGRGLNITVPFKPEAWDYADRRSARADRAGAVNTLVLDGPEVYGDNTDGPGLVRDLTVNQGYRLAGRRILLIGAGGATRGVLAPLLAERPAEVVIANRTAERARVLVEHFTDVAFGCNLRGGGLDELQHQRFDLVINATAAGLSGEVPALPDDLLADGAWCYDLLYGDRPTPFLLWAAGRGAARCLDGLGMLVEQAAESFLIWRGVRPETGPVIAALRPT
jgi:shikimate dehydrogenase